MRFRSIAASAAAAALAVTLTSGPALAHPGRPGSGHGHSSPPASHVVDVADGLISPLKVSFGPHGSHLVAQSMAGMLTRIDARGHQRTLVSAPGKEIAGVSYSRGITYYTQNDQAENPEEPPSSLLPAKLKSLDARGAPAHWPT
ncbi:hypothetical protein [Arthrobacter sp.]|uniref:hypothetical protein n=1 Tax=Arthrobacter sp. TaxID=1667 RepID=UPI003A95B353